MFWRLMILLTLAALPLVGCASSENGLGGSLAAFETTVVVDAPLPIVQNGGTAIAGWSATATLNNYDPDETPAVPDRDHAVYKLDSGDKLRVFVYAQPSLSRIYTVDNEGYISVPLIGNVHARGTSTRGLEAIIKSRLGGEFVRDPHVTVDIQQYRPFFILGEIRSAGQYPYVGGLTVDAAVAIAGGYSERANERKVQIMRRTRDGVEKFEVPGDAEIRPGDTIFVKERWF